jgi:glycosyltransferase involved in cell wall biosynthesis
MNASARKNAPGLLRIYEQLPSEVRQRYPLVIVLTHPAFRAAIEQEVHRLGLTTSVRFFARVAEDDLVLFYNAATAFIFPSLYEGFGLPVLEAMACGTPVVTSNLTSIPEVGGDAVEQADPRSEEAFAEALRRVLASPELRASLTARGLQRAAQFSWERTARMTLDVYQEVVERWPVPQRASWAC